MTSSILKRLYRFQFMGDIGRHDDHLSGGNRMRFSVDGNLSLAIHHLHKGVKRGGMLAQALAGIE